MITQSLDNLISVIIPTYNRATILIEAMDSVKKQNYRPIELLVIDDGSVDDTYDEVKKWQKTNSEELFSIVYIKKANGGAPSARNIGIKASRGAFVQFLDSDDLLLPFCLEEKYKVQKISNAEYVYSFSLITNMSGQKIGKHGIEPPKDIDHAYIVPYTFNTSGPLLKKQVFKKIGLWNEDLNGCQEIEYFFRLKKEIGSGVCLPKFLTQIRVHEANSISQIPSNKHAVSALKVLRIMASEMKKLNNRLKSGHYRNESEALSSFAIDVAIKNHKANCINNSLEALQIAKKHTQRTSKEITYSLFQFLAFFSARLTFKILINIRGGYSRLNN